MGIFATQSPEDALASDIASALVEQTATMILLPNPNASREDYVDGLKLTDAEYNVVVSLDERSRCFLVKQGHGSAVCQLNLRGMDDALAVISASTDNIEIMHEVLQVRAEAEGVSTDALRPEQWLETFYENRKGSGKGPSGPTPNKSRRAA
jgi:type IV secretion system protein VirB4